MGVETDLEARLDGLVTTAELASRPDFNLGRATVSPSRRRVTGLAGEIDVEPRVMQVLVVLSDARGQVVTRDTLFRRCWGSSAVTDDSLNRAMGCLRKITAELGEEAFRIETIARTGYRLTVAEAAEDSDAETKPSRRHLMKAGLAATVVGAGLVGYRVWTGKTTTSETANLLAQSEVALRRNSMTSDKEALALLERAAALEPSDPHVLGKLALARLHASEHAPPAEVEPLVAGTQRAALRALQIDSRQVDALASMALLPPYFGDWFAAEKRMKDVLRINPDHLPTRDALSFMLASVGMLETGFQERMKVAAADPLHAGYQFRLIYNYWFMGDLGAADRAADRALQLWPRHAGVWFARLWTLALTGRAERALLQVDDTAGLPRLPPGTVEILRKAMVALASRRPADITRASDGVVELLTKGPSHSVNALMILNGLGEIDRAFDVASAYLLERGPLMATVRWRPGQLSVPDQRRRKTHILWVPVAEQMRRDSRFMPLVRDMGMVSYWNAAKVTPDFLKA